MINIRVFKWMVTVKINRFDNKNKSNVNKKENSNDDPILINEDILIESIIWHIDKSIIV